MAQNPMIILAAGGTGGHLFPAEALARTLLDRGWRAMLVTDDRATAFDVPGVAVRRIKAGRFGGGLAARLAGLFRTGIGATQARTLLRQTGAGAVVGFGGYPSVPTVAAAGLMRKPVMLHEQNAVLGRANRLLARFSGTIALSFPETERLPLPVNTVVTGNPVRAAILALKDTPYEQPAVDGRFNLLVTGGSQGARFLGETIPAALRALDPTMRSRIHLTLQARSENLEQVRADVEALGMSAEIDSFFGDMAERLRHAHLLIARAGASTVFEAAIAARPSLLIPLPGAMDDHQTANADALAKAGGAWVLQQPLATPETLANRLAALMADPNTLGKAAERARAWAKPDAAAQLADAAQALVRRAAQEAV